MKKIQSIHIIISGIVQGVSFRAFTKNAADQLHIHGWVKNLPDGRVETLVSGAKKDIDAFIILLKTGPPFSRVERIEMKEQHTSETKEKHTGFEIHRD